MSKKGLSATLHGQIAQHFAKGGEAMDTVPGPDNSDLEALIAQGQPISLPQAAPTGLMSGSVLSAAPGSELGSVFPGGHVTDAAGNPTDLPSVLASARGTPAQAPPHAPEAVPAPKPAPASKGGAAPRGTPGAGGSSLRGELKDEEKQAVAAERAKAQVIQNEAENTAQVQAANEERRASIAADWQARWQANQARGDQLAQDIASSKVDPNHFWGNLGTGGRISASIGLILGGIGSGLAGGPNQALQVLERNIDRDIDAQKTDLGKKQNLLSHYLQQGHSIQQAAQLAKADGFDAAAGQLQMVATRYAGPKAAALAESNIAAIRQQGTQLRQRAMAEGLDLALKGEQLKAVKQAREYQVAEMGAIQAIAGGAQQSAPTGAGESGIGVKLHPQARAVLAMHKDVGPRLVDLPNGNTALAHSDKDADKIRDVLEKVGHYQELLGQLKALHTSHPHGVSEALSGKDYGSAIRLRNEAIQTAGEISNLTRLTGEEVKLRQEELPDLTKVQVGSVASGQIDQAIRDANSRILHAIRNRLVVPR